MEEQKTLEKVREDQVKQFSQKINGEQVEEVKEETREPDMAKTEQLKQQGKKHFQQANYEEAINSYHEALQYCPKNDTKMLCILNSNISVCHMKLNNHFHVIDYTKKALQYVRKIETQDPQYRKAWINQAKAYEFDEQKLDQALQCYKKASEIQKEPELTKIIEQMQKRVDKLNEKRKEQVMSGLKNIGNSILGYFGMSLDNFKLNQNENGGYSISMQK